MFVFCQAPDLFAGFSACRLPGRVVKFEGSLLHNSNQSPLVPPLYGPVIAYAVAGIFILPSICRRLSLLAQNAYCALRLFSTCSGILTRCSFYRCFV